MPFKISPKELEEWKKNGYSGKVFKSKRECEEFERREKRNRPYKNAQECYKWLLETRPDLPKDFCSALVVMEFPGEYPTFHLDENEKKDYFRMLEQKAKETAEQLLEEEKNGATTSRANEKTTSNKGANHGVHQGGSK